MDSPKGLGSRQANPSRGLVTPSELYPLPTGESDLTVLKFGTKFVVYKDCWLVFHLNLSVFHCDVSNVTCWVAVVKKKDLFFFENLKSVAQLVNHPSVRHQQLSDTAWSDGDNQSRGEVHPVQAVYQVAYLHTTSNHRVLIGRDLLV